MIFITFLSYFGLYLLVRYYDNYYFPQYSLSINVLGFSLYDMNAIINLILIFMLFYSYFMYHNLLNNSLLEKQIVLENEMDRRETSENNTRKLFDDWVVSYKNLEQFSFVVSHNMRAPLANIKGFVGLMHNSPIDSAESQHMVKFVEKAANQLDDVLTDLNSILRNKNLLIEERTEVCFDEIVEEVLQSLKDEISMSKIRILKEYVTTDYVFVIKGVLKSSIFYLVQNAIKFRKTWESTLIVIDFSTFNDCYIIKISDNGIGIDLTRYQARVFSLYSKFHHGFEGKGMGLYLVKNQVEFLGGRVEIASKVNKGSTFTIEIPINR